MKIKSDQDVENPDWRRNSLANASVSSCVEVWKTSKDWQTGVITPIFKKGDHKQWKNYRGISTLLSLPGKVSEVESRTQGSRPRTQKKFRGQDQGQTLSRPRTKDTDASVLQKKIFKKFFMRKRSSKIFFRRSLLEETKKRSLQLFRKVSGVFQRNFNGLKIVLTSSRGQGNFRELEASRPRPRTSKCVLEDVLEAKDVLEDSTSGKYTAKALKGIAKK